MVLTALIILSPVVNSVGMSSQVLLTLILCLHFLHIASSESEVVETVEDCSEKELGKVQDEFNQCSLRFGFEFEDTRHVFIQQIYLQEAACIFISNIIEKCGQVWKRCHTKQEVFITAEGLVFFTPL